MRWVIVRFVDIGGIIDHHCLRVLLMFTSDSNLHGPNKAYKNESTVLNNIDQQNCIKYKR